MANTPQRKREATQRQDTAQGAAGSVADTTNRDAVSSRRRCKTRSGFVTLQHWQRLPAAPGHTWAISPKPNWIFVYFKLFPDAQLSMVAEIVLLILEETR